MRKWYSMENKKVAKLISENLKSIYGYAFARLYDKDDVDDLTSEIVLLSSPVFHGYYVASFMAVAGIKIRTFCADSLFSAGSSSLFGQFML